MICGKRLATWSWTLTLACTFSLASPSIASAALVIDSAFTDGDAPSSRGGGNPVDIDKTLADNVTGHLGIVNRRFEWATADVLSGRLNIGRFVTDTADVRANWTNVLSLAEPEIGDLESLVVANPGTPSTSTILQRSPFVTLGDHLPLANPVIITVNVPGEPDCVGDPDIQANAQTRQSPNPKLKADKVSEPSSLTLLSVGLIVISLSMRHQSRKTQEP